MSTPSSLVLLDEQIISSSVSTVSVGQTNWDTNFNVYVVQWDSIQTTTDNVSLYMRLTEGGVQDTTANYDWANYTLKSYASGSAGYSSNQQQWFLGQLGTPTQEQGNGTAYLFNMNSTTRYVQATFEITNWNSISSLSGEQGGAVHTEVGTAKDGITILASSGNLDTGSVRLYGLKK